MADSIGTKEFSEKYGVNQQLVSKWCRNNLIEGAEQDAKGSPWHIPKNAKPPIGYKPKRKKVSKK